jgi:hypothetical protein
MTWWESAGFFATIEVACLAMTMKCVFCIVFESWGLSPYHWLWSASEEHWRACELSLIRGYILDLRKHSSRNPRTTGYRSCDGYGLSHHQLKKVKPRRDTHPGLPHYVRIIWRSLPALTKGAHGRSGLSRPSYLARLNTFSEVPPDPGAVAVIFMSSPVKVTGFFVSAATWFGSMLPSMRLVRVLPPSSTDQVPNWALVP